MKFASKDNGMRFVSVLHISEVYKKLLKAAEVMLIVFLAMHFLDTGHTAPIPFKEGQTFLPYIAEKSSKYGKMATGLYRPNLDIVRSTKLTMGRRIPSEASTKFPRNLRQRQLRFLSAIAAQDKVRYVSNKRISRRKRENRETTKQSKKLAKTWPHRCFVKRYNSNKVMLECNPSHVVFYIARTRFPTNTSHVGKNNGFSDQSQELRELYSLHDAIGQFGTPTDVTDLRLWYQGIIFVESFAFRKLNRLKSLKMQNNKISYLSKHAFYGLTSLKEMDLSYNRLQSIPNNIFQPLSKLEILRLGNNELSYVQNGMFCGLRSLVNLDLSHNAIEDIAPHALRHFRSKYTVLIELGYNKLKRPRFEWLQCFEEVLDPLCYDGDSTNNVSSNLYPEIDNVTTQLASDELGIRENSETITEHRLRIKENQSRGTNLSCSASLREFRAIHNPWTCSCNSSFNLLEFLELYNTIVTSQFSNEIADDNVKVRYSENNATIILPKGHSPTNITNKTHYLNYYKWHFTMPCATPAQLAGLDLGITSPNNQQRKRFQESCCNEITGTKEGLEFAQGDRIAQSVCSDKLPKKDMGLSDNEVTIIGIVIVFVTPILLTLCPDCDREIVPSSGGGVMSAGKFGAMSSNYNNNVNSNEVCPDSHKMVRTSKSGTFLDPRMCRKSRTQSVALQYNEEIV